MTLSRRTLFFVPVATAVLITFPLKAWAAIKPKAISNKVPGGGSLRNPGYLAEMDNAGRKVLARSASDSVRVGIALYGTRAQIVAEGADGKIIDLIDVRMGDKYIVGMPIDVYLRGTMDARRLVLIEQRTPFGHAIDIEWKTGRLKQVEIARTRGPQPNLREMFGVGPADLQGQITLRPGVANLWEIER